MKKINMTDNKHLVSYSLFVATFVFLILLIGFTAIVPAFRSIVIPTVSASLQSDCEDSGGQWVLPNGVRPECQCPSGSSISNGVCESIPPGCPGATTQGPRAPGVECPYEAPPSSDGTQSVDEEVDSGELKTDCETLDSENCEIIRYLVILINFLSAVALLAITASVMFAGYQYMTARDNPGAVQAAKVRIVWALVALALFVFGYGLLNFLVPGGVL